MSNYSPKSPVGILDSTLHWFSVSFSKSEAKAEDKERGTEKKPEDVEGQIEGGAEIADEERDDSRLTGLKDELILLEGQESTDDGGKRLRSATVERDALKNRKERLIKW